MTTVYGVTFVGAREQIEKQLKAVGWVPHEDTWGASSYLAKVVCTKTSRSQCTISHSGLYNRFLAVLEISSREPQLFKHG